MNQTNERPKQRRPTRDQSIKTPISFRLDIENEKRLEARAAQLGISRHVLARHYAVAILQEKEERIVLREAVTQLQQIVASLVENLSLGVEVLLSGGGKLDPKEAAEWVDKNLDAQ